jgi:hypothetical protein
MSTQGENAVRVDGVCFCADFRLSIAAVTALIALNSLRRQIPDHAPGSMVWCDRWRHREYFPSAHVIRSVVVLREDFAGDGY